jgi:hypothetical protein
MMGMVLICWLLLCFFTQISRDRRLIYYSSPFELLAEMLIRILCGAVFFYCGGVAIPNIAIVLYSTSQNPSPVKINFSAIVHPMHTQCTRISIAL